MKNIFKLTLAVGIAAVGCGIMYSMMSTQEEVIDLSCEDDLDDSAFKENDMENN